MSRKAIVGEEDKDQDRSGWVIPTKKKGQKNARTDAALTVLVSMGLATAFFALFGGLRGAVTGAIVGAFWGAYRIWTGDA
ncbi:hypothetical protein HMPREF0989_02454 [Ralstonia sp. 5_2_56FAA]|nr:hypothetical protein HMPREF0989_02454 [Ralstonia sp. 5_2_56FAA]QQK34501.1 hypothetical protein RP6297_00687 [Ralstonia pickettii]SCW52632.1 hypothetical protein SAMN02799637_01263 [Ralstonia sp. UNCCL144]